MGTVVGVQLWVQSKSGCSPRVGTVVGAVVDAAVGAGLGAGGCSCGCRAKLGAVPKRVQAVVCRQARRRCKLSAIVAGAAAATQCWLVGRQAGGQGFRVTMA